MHDGSSTTSQTGERTLTPSSAALLTTLPSAKMLKAQQNQTYYKRKNGRKNKHKGIPPANAVLPKRLLELARTLADDEYPDTLADYTQDSTEVYYTAIRNYFTLEESMKTTLDIDGGMLELRWRARNVVRAYQKMTRELHGREASD